ncbi:MAG: hypothetical protein JXA30_08530 [Deltaproteobacteria bacterium]|nr:hypothetical protein [Deltaproteobacteria bacterium]
MLKVTLFLREPLGMMQDMAKKKANPITARHQLGSKSKPFPDDFRAIDLARRGRMLDPKIPHLIVLVARCRIFQAADVLQEIRYAATAVRFALVLYHLFTSRIL